ncbi:hypothetical protein [uncultured Thiodictyon sp.]|uniref:hypothetical protein n=1 Tax=uncultured Thiodictyon sp. TaxID=1846217 RepID=UPI0025EEDDE7|nr:hypothetical protein [uncultured Thiodictyon sp.]
MPTQQALVAETGRWQTPRHSGRRVATQLGTNSSLEHLVLFGFNSGGLKLDLSLLADIKKLRFLSINPLDIDDLTPLYRCEHLDYLGLTSTKLADGQLEALQRVRPELKVDVNDLALP